MIIIMIPYIINMISLSQHAYSPEAILDPTMTYLVSVMIFSFVMVFAQVIVYLFRGLALHKIFSRYNAGQKPVFYVIISLFVPLAESILLFMHRNKPLLMESDV